MSVYRTIGPLVLIYVRLNIFGGKLCVQVFKLEPSYLVKFHTHIMKKYLTYFFFSCPNYDPFQN